ncbi:MAG: 3-hydroxyacyl-CoA dehydrogenase family protein [Myxococcota bacterium]
MSTAETIERLVVVGAGTMGHGIAQVAATSGYQVILYDVSTTAIENGLAAIRQNLATGVQKGKLSADAQNAALQAIRTSTDLPDAARQAQLVIEAAPEKLAIKQQIFAELDAAAPTTCILATNTSSLSITEIAAATTRPDRVIGMHFFNPPHILKLLEIVRAEQTSRSTLETTQAIGKRLGREIIVVNDTPGFATSRLGLVLGLEAIRMVQEGVASPEDIDAAMELGYRHPMGPLRLTDLIGLDVRLAIATYLHAELGHEQFRPPQLLRRMVRAGKLGKKSGQGFYTW